LFNEEKKFSFRDINNVEKSIFPFTFEYIENKIENKNRAGWIYAQLVKFYFVYLHEGNDNVLVVDSDVFFTGKINFLEQSNKPIFTVSSEYHQPYFDHMLRVHPDFTRAYEKSGISHHMFFNKKLLTEMFEKVEKFHKKPFYEIYLDALDGKENSPSSEYEMYLNYVLKYHKEKCSIREIKWKNVSLLTFKDFRNYMMISLPHYAGTRPNNFVENVKKVKKIRALKSFYNYFFLKFNNLLINIGFIFSRK
jgi:Ni,Fe-hydrogenase maturation factor